MARVLVIDNGGPSPQVAHQWGNFADWFAARLPPSVTVHRHLSTRSLPPPDELEFDGLILSGSTHGVREEHPWAHQEAEWALGVADLLPVLAVCFGHQLLAEVLGGRVEENPKGPERGGITVQLTEAGAADPLFAGLPTRLPVHSSHRDAVVRPPSGAVLLASTENTGWQAFSWGPRVRCVQFHPEFAPGPMAAILRSYDPAGQHFPAPHTPDLGAAVLERWAAHWLAAADGPDAG